MFICFLLLLPLSINSYNFHGWNIGVQMVDTENHNIDIIMLQKHWLYPSTIERLNNNNNTHEVFTISSIKDDFTELCTIWKTSSVDKA